MDFYGTLVAPAAAGTTTAAFAVADAGVGSRSTNLVCGTGSGT